MGLCCLKVSIPKHTTTCTDASLAYVKGDKPPLSDTLVQKLEKLLLDVGVGFSLVVVEVE